ncbi:MAG: response regulator [Synergistaceae bacterium]|nr:response regulator [Synergistaceae bacterium]
MPKKIFIIDDADFMVDILLLIVQEAGHVVVGTAFNGVQALEAIENLPTAFAPEVVTVDFHMPKLDGMETVRRIRTLVPGVRIILISAHATFPVVMQAKDVGVDVFIAKPFEPQAILNAIDKLG